jgi:threonine/homoserine/homoserine lactone efflux protein
MGFKDSYKTSKERTMKNDSYGDGRIWLVSLVNDFWIAWFVMLFAGNLHQDFSSVPLLSYWNAFMITILITTLISGGMLSTHMKLSREYKKNIGSGKAINIDGLKLNDRKGDKDADRTNPVVDDGGDPFVRGVN